VASLQNRPIEDVAVTTFKTWGIGKKDKNNGVLFLIAPNDRRMRIEVGYGLEGVLPDGRTGRIMDEAVAPYFRQGRMAQGVLEGTKQIANVLAQNAGVDLSPEFQADVPNGISLRLGRREKAVLIFVLFVLVILVTRHPWLIWFLLSNSGRGGSGRGGGWSGGGFGGGGFGGFGGGSSGGGGASRGR
jgi:uncharacterized protein